MTNGLFVNQLQLSTGPWARSSACRLTHRELLAGGAGAVAQPTVVQEMTDWKAAGLPINLSIVDFRDQRHRPGIDRPQRLTAPGTPRTCDRGICLSRRWRPPVPLVRRTPPARRTSRSGGPGRATPASPTDRTPSNFPGGMHLCIQAQHEVGMTKRVLSRTDTLKLPCDPSDFGTESVLGRAGRGIRGRPRVLLVSQVTHPRTDCP